jgi:hypothetical protein
LWNTFDWNIIWWISPTLLKFASGLELLLTRF